VIRRNRVSTMSERERDRKVTGRGPRHLAGKGRRSHLHSRALLLYGVILGIFYLRDLAYTHFIQTVALQERRRWPTYLSRGLLRFRRFRSCAQPVGHLGFQACGLGGATTLRAQPRRATRSCRGGGGQGGEHDSTGSGGLVRRGRARPTPQEPPPVPGPVPLGGATEVVTSTEGGGARYSCCAPTLRRGRPAQALVLPLSLLSILTSRRGSQGPTPAWPS